MSLIYIQIRKNRITVRNVDTQQQASGSATFSTERLLVGEFFPSEDLICQLAKLILPT